MLPYNLTIQSARCEQGFSLPAPGWPKYRRVCRRLRVGDALCACTLCPESPDSVSPAFSAPSMNVLNGCGISWSLAPGVRYLVMEFIWARRLYCTIHGSRSIAGDWDSQAYLVSLLSSFRPIAIFYTTFSTCAILTVGRPHQGTCDNSWRVPLRARTRRAEGSPLRCKSIPKWYARHVVSPALLTIEKM